jgi:type I restriction enzyme, S subunit
VTLLTSAIGDVVLPVATWNPQDSGRGEFTYIDIAAVDRETKSIEGAARLRCSDAPSRARQLVQTGDILVSTVRPGLNAVAMVLERHDGATASTGFTVLRPNPERVVGAYLFHWLRTPTFVRGMVKVATGASYPAVSDRIVLASTFALPPLPEQRRIADILDKADAIRRKRREGIPLAEGLLRSAFLDMFGDPVTNPKRWPRRKLGEEAERVTVGYVGPVSAHYVEEGVPIFRTGNVGPGALRRTHLLHVTKAFHDAHPNSSVKAGDILLTRHVVDRLHCAVVPNDLGAAQCLNIILVRPGRRIRGAYVVATLSNSGIQRELLGARVGTAQSVVNTRVLQRLALPVPPLELQTTFTTLVEKTRQLQTRYELGVAATEGLFGGLMLRAFRGELTGSEGNRQLAIFRDAVLDVGA